VTELPTILLSSNTLALFVRSVVLLRRTSFQLSKPSDTTHSARPMGQPGRGRGLLDNRR